VATSIVNQAVHSPVISAANLPRPHASVYEVATQRIIEQNAEHIGGYISQTWGEDVDTRTLQIALEQLRDRLVFIPAEQAEVAEILQKLDQGQRDTVASWNRAKSETRVAPVSINVEYQAKAESLQGRTHGQTDQARKLFIMVPGTSTIDWQQTHAARERFLNTQVPLIRR
jgi:hypothetical protein